MRGEKGKTIQKVKSDFGREEDEKVRRSLIVYEMVEAEHHDQLLVENEMIRQGIWDKKREVKIEKVVRLGRGKGDGRPRPLTIVMATQEDADIVYIRSLMYSGTAIQFKRYRSTEKWKN